MNPSQQKDLTEKITTGLIHGVGSGKNKGDKFWWTWSCEFAGLPVSRVDVMTCDNATYHYRFHLRPNAAGIPAQNKCGSVCCSHTSENLAVYEHPPMNQHSAEMVRRCVGQAVRELFAGDEFPGRMGGCCDCQTCVPVRLATPGELETMAEDFGHEDVDDFLDEFGETFRFLCSEHFNPYDLNGRICPGSGTTPQALVAE